MGMVVVTTMGSDNGIKDKILGMRLNRKQPFVERRTAPDKARKLVALI